MPKEPPLPPPANRSERAAQDAIEAGGGEGLTGQPVGTKPTPPPAPEPKAHP
jgi:hypothetical protein